MKELERLQENDIVILSDVRDVVYFGTPSEVISEFKKAKKKIVISSTFQCCVTNYIPYIQEYSNKNGEKFEFESLAFPDLNQQDEIKRISDEFFAIEAPKRANNDKEFQYFWTQGQHEIITGMNDYNKSDLVKNSNNRFGNAGTIIGYRDDILAALKQINPTPWYDDEESWNLWFAKLANYESYSPDFFESIFAIVTSTSRPNGNELSVLKLENDWPEDKFPYRTFFRFRYDKGNLESYWHTNPKIFHCPGCSLRENGLMRKKVVTALRAKYPKFEQIFTKIELKRINSF
jgi:hypothetical protein